MADKKSSYDQSIGAAMEFLTKNTSAYKFRKSITDEALEKTLTDIIRQNQTLRGVVLTDGQQVPASDGDGPEARNIFHQCAKIRIFEIHDKIFPDPRTFRHSKQCGAFLERLVEAHPIVYSKEQPSEGEAVEAGDGVFINFIDGEPRFTPNGEYLDDYSQNWIGDLYEGAYSAFQNLDTALNSVIGVLGPEAGALAYDRDSNIPNKSRNDPYINELHKEFQPKVKAFIWSCWNQYSVKIRINSGYRTPAEQRKLWNKWQDPEKNANTNKEEYRAKNPKPAKPKTSFHNVGLAFDFNPTFPTGRTLLQKDSKDMWQKSGIPELGESYGLRWGGNFAGNYDPIHFDMLGVDKSRIAQMIDEVGENGDPRTVSTKGEENV